MNRRAFMAALGAACLPVPAFPAPTTAGQVLAGLDVEIGPYSQRAHELLSAIDHRARQELLNDPEFWAAP